MPPAARITDPTAHPGTIVGPGAANVLVAGLPAAVVGDNHACSFPPPASHPPTPIVQGSSSVLIGGLPAARAGDTAGCGAPILPTQFQVLIGG